MATLLAIEWNVVGIKAGQLLLCLSILVVLHEMGHFLPAKWFKCRVEKFYLFFDPWFSLFKKKIGDTVYGIGWLPLGGYVKISGMIDESMDKEQMSLPPQPYEFRSKKPWQRLIIMVGGVTVNLILGFFIFSMILWKWGEEYLPTKNAVYGVYVDSLGKKVGMVDGDKIIGVDNRKVENFDKLSNEIILNEAKTIQVDRNGQTISLPIPPGTVRELIKRKGDPIAWAKFPSVVDSVSLKVAKFTSGALQRNDEIIALNGMPVTSHYALVDMKKDMKNKEVDLTVLRNQDTLHVKCMLNNTASIGFAPFPPEKFLVFDTLKYNFLQALPAGVKKGWGTLVMNIQHFKLLFTSKEVKPSESLGSFISIGSMFDAGWDWQRFWTMTALLSIVLAFMNILPIPALDGGHVLFTLYEIITGRKPSDKFMEYAQMVGMVLLLGIMAYALGLDFWRFLFKH
jgi:regulator of sigma E protease